MTEQFAFNFLSGNYIQQFNRYRLTVERKKIDFDTNANFSYNDTITLAFT